MLPVSLKFFPEVSMLKGKALPFSRNQSTSVAIVNVVNNLK